MPTMVDDVPTSSDFRRSDHAKDWTESANTVRPWRNDFFAAFVGVIAGASSGHSCRVLELGSGPGFLAEQLLRSNEELSYVALDFSATMHELARQRLGALAPRAQFIERSLRDAHWNEGLGQFNFVVTHQAVHELRHKRYAVTLHTQARATLLPGGSYLVCDHFHGEGGMSNAQLYMTVDEQREALLAAGFTRVEQVLLKGGLVLHQAS
jgi:SAM-dependent methyltransferase